MTEATQAAQTAGKRALPWGAILKLAGSAAVLGLLFLFIPAGEVWFNLSRVNPLVWLGVFVVHVLGHCLAAWKWRSLIGGKLPYQEALRAHFSGLAANLALPGVAGGDVVRAAMVMRGQTTKSDLVLGSLVDRLIDTATLLAIAAVGATLLGSDNLRWTYIATGVLAALGLGGVFLLKPIAGLLIALPVPGKARKLTQLLSEAFMRLADRKLAILLCVGLSIGVQATFALLNCALSASIGGPASIGMWLFAWPMAKLIATLPISFGGIGVREASLSGLFAPFGYAAAPVIAASLLWQTILVGAGLVGGLAPIWLKAARSTKKG